MKVLVTGGCGFLGHNLCAYYAKQGWDVVAYDNLTKFEYSRIPYLNLEKVRNYGASLLRKMGVEVVVGDVRDKEVLSKAARGCDYIIHTAAQPAMTIAIEKPELDMDVNVLGALNVFNVARKYGIPVANCSTVHIYGNNLNRSLQETGKGFVSLDYSIGMAEDGMVLDGLVTPLHASKRSAEIYAQAFSDTYRARIGTFRLTGMYGGGQFGGEDHGWVANFAFRTILGLPIRVFGTDMQVRDILYIDDAARAFDGWFKAGCPSGIFNVGGGMKTATSISECLQELHLITGKKQNITLEPARQGDLWWFVCNTNKFESHTDWQAKVEPKVGLRKLVSWIEANRSLLCNV